MWWLSLTSSLVVVLVLLWLVVYGASLYDRRPSTARHRADIPLMIREQMFATDELEDALDESEDAVAVGE